MAHHRAAAPAWGRALRVTIGIAALLSATTDGAGAQSLGEIFRKVAPSVVVIRARGRDITAEGQQRFTETGSGVIVSKDGKVMTAAHVVHAMDEIVVEFLGGESVAARVVASEPAADLSLLQLDHVPPGTTIASLADSDVVNVGDQVFVVGAPYGLGHSLSVGWISARWAPNTVYRRMPLAEFFQTDAVINTGNSGGPVFSLAGEVIALVSHNISKSGGSEGLGFVVTLNTARRLLLERRSFWSGLEGLMLTNELADLLNLPPKSNGFAVKTVAKDSPGDRLGLRGSTQVVRIDGQDVPLGGDIILSVEGISMHPQHAEKLRALLSALQPNAPFKITILRAGQVLELTGHAP
jgi:serine protease Do